MATATSLMATMQATLEAPAAMLAPWKAWLKVGHPAPDKTVCVYLLFVTVTGMLSFRVKGGKDAAIQMASHNPP